MIEDPPFHLLCPGRRPTGIGPVLLPMVDNDVEWAGFAHLLGRVADTPLLPGVNLGPGAGDRIGHRLRMEVVATAGAGLGGEPFVAGVWTDDSFDPDRLAVEVQTIASRGGVPLLMPSPALDALGPDGLVGLVAWMADWCDRLLVVEGASSSMADFGAFMEIGACIGVVHASGSRSRQWERLERRDEVRGDFQVFSAEASAIDQIMFGADHCLDLSAAVPDLVAARDDLWEREDLSTLELQDALQFLSSLIARDRASVNDALARVLRLRGWLAHDEVMGGGPRRPEWEDELLAQALERLA